MTAIASQKAGTTVRAPGWAIGSILILAVGLAILFLGEVGLLAPDLMFPAFPHAPGAPDLARSLA